MELGGDQARLPVGEVHQPDHDQGRQRDQEDGAADVTEESRELEQLEHVGRLAHDLVRVVALLGGQDQRVHSNSLSAPFATATASQASNTR